MFYRLKKKKYYLLMYFVCVLSMNCSKMVGRLHSSLSKFIAGHLGPKVTMKSASLGDIIYETFTLLYWKYLQESRHSSLSQCKGHSHNNITSTKASPGLTPHSAANTHSLAGQTEDRRCVVTQSRPSLNLKADNVVWHSDQNEKYSNCFRAQGCLPPPWFSL